VVHVRETISSAEVEHYLLKSTVSPRAVLTHPPAALEPPGLDASRQSYLYRYIRDYVEEPWKDIMCPVPGTVFPLTDPPLQPSTSTAHDSDAASSDAEYLPPKRGRGRASHGQGRGHADDHTSAMAGRGRGRGKGRKAKCK